MTALVQSLFPSYRSAPALHWPRPRINWRSLFGPGLLVAVGFVDPGNWATDLVAGSRFGYALIGAVLLASWLGWLFQHLASRLALATGQDLASLTRHHLPPSIANLAWLTAELAIVATTVAELLGAAIALQLVFGWSVLTGVMVGASSSSLLLTIRQGGRPLYQYVIAGLLAAVAASFGYLLLAAHPDPAQALHGLLHSAEVIEHPVMLPMVIGIVGATVMPHNLYLHSSLTAAQVAGQPAARRQHLVAASERDTRNSLLLASVINIAILGLAAASLNQSQQPIASLAEAHRAIGGALGPLAAAIFAIALYAAGQSSALTGMVAGRAIRNGFAPAADRGQRRLWLSRLAGTSVCLLLVWAAPHTSADHWLLLTQTALSLVLPFALLPLLLLVTRRSLMGALALSRPMLMLAVSMSVLILGLDAGSLLLAG